MAGFKPPHYEWTAVNADETLSALRSATKMVEAYLSLLAPGDSNEGFMQRQSAKDGAPVRMVMVIDLTDLAEAIQERQAALVPDDATVKWRGDAPDYKVMRLDEVSLSEE